MKFVLISPKNRTVYNFRGDLLKKIQSLGYEVIVTGPSRDDIERIEALGVRFVQIPLEKTGLNILADLKYTWNLMNLLKKEKPDAILGYTIKPVIYGAIAGKLAGVKKINSMITGLGYVFTADTKKARILRTLASILYRIGFSFSNVVIFQNQDDMKELLTLGLLKEDKCRLVNGSGVNMALFKPSDYPVETTFFMLSRLLYSKGVREYLTAAKAVKSAYPKTRFMLLGGAENMQDSMGLGELQPYMDQGIIEYFGETSNVAQYYAQSSVYVLPSYREGTPRTVLEAMAMGRPIITTDAPGCRETVVDGMNGFLVPVKNTQVLEEKMIWFIENPHVVAEMGKASLDLCREKFEVNKVNEDMVSYMKL